MKKLFLLIGLVVFLTPMVGAYDSPYKKCKIKNNKVVHEVKKCGSWCRCHGKIKYPDGDIYEGEFLHGYFEGRGTYKYPNGDVYEGYWNSGKYHGEGTLTLANGNKKVGEWKIGNFIKETKLSEDSLEEQQTKDKLLNQNNTTSLMSTVDSNLLNAHCIANQNKSAWNGGIRCFCEGNNGFVSNVDPLHELQIRTSPCQNEGKEITYGRYLELEGYLLAGQYIELSKEQLSLQRNEQLSLLGVVKPKISSKKNLIYPWREIRGGVKKNKEASFDELAIALGCGIKRKDVEDCVRRYLPSFMGQGPMTMGQINEIKNNKEIMGEVVFVIQQMNRADSGSSQPSEEEQRQAQASQGNQQYRGYNPIAEKIWNKMGWTTLRRNPTSMSTFTHTYIGK